MTTAHRPTFDPARGKEERKGPAYHQRLLPAFTHLKTRQPGQGGSADATRRDLRAELLKAEAVARAKKAGLPAPKSDDGSDTEMPDDTPSTKRAIEDGNLDEGSDNETPEAKRRRILEATRDLDADSSASSSSDSDSDEESDEEDDTAELMRELEKIKRERAEAKEREEAEKAKEEEEKNMVDIAMGNPLLNPKKDFTVKRSWDDDVIFKNQARGVEERGKRKEFVNDLLRSDFHKRFMNKYVR